MATQPGTLELLLGEIGPILAPLFGRLSPPDTLALFAELGIQFPPALLDDGPLVNALNDAATNAQALAPLLEELAAALDSDDVAAVVEKVLAIVDRLTALFASLDTVSTRLESAAAALGMSSADVIDLARQLPRRALELLVVERLETVPAVAATLQLLGVIDRVLVPEVPGDPTHPEFERKELHLENLVDFVQSPASHLERLSGWGSATFDPQRLFDQLEDFFSRLGVPVALTPATATEPLTLHITLFEVRPESTLTPPGLALTLGMPIEADISTTVGLGHPAWSLEATTRGRFDAGLTGSIRPPADFTLLPPTGTLDGELRLQIVGQLPASGPRLVLLGVAGSSRLEVGRVEALLGMRFVSDGIRSVGETIAEASLSDGRVILDPSEGDGFVNDVLGGASGEAAFDVRAFWSADTGVRFEGSSSLEIAIPIHASVGIVELTTLVIRSFPADGAIPVEVSGNFRGRLGPLQFVVERLGIELTATTPETRGNVGPVQLDAAFKPPTGIGLSVDGGGFTGGGFLRFEPEQARYAGLLELEFEDQFTLKAIGLLSTRLPDGQRGFSLLIVISAEFTPIQLGFGFRLDGVGGLLGLHRTVTIDRLVTGLRDNTLRSILFPVDIVANADRLLSDLQQVFPPARGRFLFGPMAKISWGTPPLLTADVGLIVEVPEPIRLAILGVVRGILPTEATAIVKLQVNFLGVLELAAQYFAFDASLFESKLLAFPLTGDMALRLTWGADPNFLLSVGGFHPAYQPPPLRLPALRRVTVALLDGDNPKLTLEVYFAITSNTAQVGARVELSASAWKFTAYGFLSFDALFQFNPFAFVAEVTAMLALRVGSSTIASITLTLTLEGPTPWKAKGEARLKLCWFLTVKVRFNRTFGESRQTTLPDLLVVPLLIEALQARDNWEGELPAHRHRLESLREAPPGPEEVRVHPIGMVKISQKVVPLNVAVDRVGSQRPSDGQTFAIANVQVGTGSTTSGAAQDLFAPAQFFAMTDAEKLASASFARFDSGVRVGDDRPSTGYAAAREVPYELKYIDRARDQRLARPGGRVVVDVTAFHTWTLQGAIARSELSFARRRKSHLAPEEVATLRERFAIVRSADLQPFDDDSVMGAERSACARRNALIAADPALRGSLQVVPVFEMSA